VAADEDICLTPSYWLRPIMLCLPAWFRFAQCLRRYRDTREAFPHLVNAGKYSTTFFAVFFATLRAWDEAKEEPSYIFAYPWAAAAVASSLYAYSWDIRMDWGLLDSGAGAENRYKKKL